MNMTIDLVLKDVYSIGSLLLTYLLIFFIANAVYSKTAGYSVKQEVVENNNVAVATSLAGYMIAISIIFIGGLIGPSVGLVEDVITVSTYSGLGIILLYIAHIINDRLILPQFNNNKELVDDRNVGTGVVQAGSYIASGLIIAGSIHGEGGGIMTTLAFFALGQIALIIFGKIYDAITDFNLHDEIENDNVAAGIAFAGTLTALGIILSNAAAGDFISWEHNMAIFVVNIVVAFLLLPLFRTVIDKLIIVNIDINDEIKTDHNIGAGLLECASTIGFATLLFFAI